MDFFTVWWFDLIFGFALLSQIGACVAKRFRLNAVFEGFVAVLSVILELALLVSLLFLGGTLTDVLITLMACALVACVAALFSIKRETEPDQ